VALVGGMLIDGTGRDPVEEATLVIDGSKIVDVGESRVVRIPSDCRKVSVSGLTIMPGMIDCHVHLTGCRGEDEIYWNGGVEPVPLRAVRAVYDAWKVLDVGFTTVRDCGSLNAVHLRKAVDEGVIAGPRVVPCARGLSRTGGHCDLRTDIFDISDQSRIVSLPFAELCDGVEGVRRAVRSQIRNGAEFIKFWASGGGTWWNDRNEDQHFTREEMKTIIDEGHMCNRRVVAHCESLESAKAAVELGIDTLEHGDVLDEAVCKEMARKGIIFDPTVSIFSVGPWAAPTDLQQKSFNTARAAGVKMALGSDAFVDNITPYGRYNIGEIRKLVDWGLSAKEAIVSATLRGAEALGRQDELGTLEKGKIADILIVDGNPLGNIDVLLDRRRIKKIIKAGREMARVPETMPHIAS